MSALLGRLAHRNLKDKEETHHFNRNQFKLYLLHSDLVLIMA